jgi:DNA adenine methylase
MTQPEPKVTAIAPWFGGKRILAQQIVPQFGGHDYYFEPFCGSMAILFAKPPSKVETVNDLHGDLTNLAWVLQDLVAAERLYDRLIRVLFFEDLLTEAVARVREAIPIGERLAGDAAIDRAYWYFLASWMSRNGVAGTQDAHGHGYAIAVRWKVGGGSPTIRFKSAVDSIPAWHDRLRNVIILRRDAFTILDRLADVPTTCIYADPPYLADSRSGFNGNGGGGARSRYVHEFSNAGLFAKDDHQRLQAMLTTYRNARIVVSYYDHPRIRELYHAWTCIPLRARKNLVQQNGGDSPKTEAPEILLINGPSYTTGNGK